LLVLVNGDVKGLLVLLGSVSECVQICYGRSYLGRVECANNKLLDILRKSLVIFIKVLIV